MGTVLDQDGKPFSWKEKYNVFAREINPGENIPTEKVSSWNVMVRSQDEKGNAGFLSVVPPGAFEFVLQPKYEFKQKMKPEEILGDVQRVTITDQKEVKLDLRLKPLKKD